ncbi:MAG: hypothetical protein ACRYGG_18940 [Janthinobacterium lividum]
MADLIGQGNNGYVDETTGGNEASKPITMSMMVFSLGQGTSDYQALMGLSQPSGDSSLLAVLCPAQRLRLEDCNSDGTIDLVTDIAFSSLTSQQLTACRVTAMFSNAQRELWLDNTRIALDTRAQTGRQYWKTLGVNYGLHPPVSSASLQLYSGYANAADIANMVAGYDGRDVALKSSRNLTIVRQFITDGDFTERTGLYNGFLNNSTHNYDQLLELDSSVHGSFGTKTFPSIPWSQNGKVIQPQITAST